jgi:hypothetical protein
VPIKAGENNGRTLPHKNIVRSLKSIGKWTGAPLKLPSISATGLKSVLLLQSGTGGPIIAARRL